MKLLLQGELQTAAQSLADESLSLARKTEHYTAWSGVTTLLKKGLVTRWSNPAKFAITDAGAELAARILAVERGDVAVSDSKRDSNGQDSSEMRKRRLEKFDKVNVNLFNDGDDGLRNVGRSNASSQGNSFSSGAGAANGGSGSVSTADFDLGDTFNLSDVGLSSGTSTSAAPAPAPALGPAPATLPVCLQLQQQQSRLQAAPSARANTHQPEFVLAAGSFDVVLCVDNTETVGGGAGGRKTLKEDTARHLQQCGVMYDRRNLNIGDFLWIARERVQEVGGQYQQRQPRELVLPYIVERKRVDDLWQSVKDGRYEEQKFRLKGCGLTHLHYLIEDFATKREFWGRAGAGAGALVTPEAIEQAVANTAVQEGFTVKKTADQKASIEYLTLITRLLRKKYRDTALVSCTQSDISDGLVGRRDTTLLTFAHFNETSRKSKALSVGEAWAKMLLRMKGLSVEMAQAIVSHYPTPRHLLDAYSCCHTAAEKTKLLSDLTYGMENKRKIPKSVAEALMKVWTLNSLS